jgi:hypothetical protein
MRNPSFFAAILAAGASGVSAHRYVLDEFDVIGGHPGTVEAVQEAPAPRRMQAFAPDFFEHRVRPEMREELVIRLDGGAVITLPRDDALPLQPGQRVRVTFD